LAIGAGLNQPAPTDPPHLLPAAPHDHFGRPWRDQTGVVARERVHQPGHRPGTAGHQQQVRMVAHQYVGVQPVIEPGQPLPQTLQIPLAVFVVQVNEVMKVLTIVATIFIPLIGELFKSQRTVERRTNLYIFLRPKILKDASFADLKAESVKALADARRDTAKMDTPQKKNFFVTAENDHKKSNVTPPGTPERAFDYQGLPGKDD
jgi:hypothetical protein